MPLVIVKESSYEYKKLRSDVFDILSQLDDNNIKSGSKVLIKPNLLGPAKAEKAVTTHPLVIKAAVEYVLEKGGKVQVSDSPPTGRLGKVIKQTGLGETLKGMPVVLKELDSPVKVSTNRHFNNLEISEDALNADVIVNLPKLKTHSQMDMTLAVKNLFGCVVGLTKAGWHVKVGENREHFAELLVSIYELLNPPLNLIDGILAMEGDGPGTGGTPRRMGLLIGSNDALSADIAVCNIIGIDPFSLETNRAAKRFNLVKEFEMPAEIRKVDNFILPKSSNIVFGPRFTKKFIRRNFTSRPKSNQEECKLCNECINLCPAKAIKSNGKELDFDYEKCIRCFCCHEICPHGAIEIQEPFLRKTIKRVIPSI